MQKNVAEVVHHYKIPKHIQSGEASVPVNSKVAMPLGKEMAELMDGMRSTQEILGELLIRDYDVRDIYRCFHEFDQQGLIREMEGGQGESLFSATEQQYLGSQIKTLDLISKGPAHAAFLQMTGNEIQVLLLESKVLIYGAGLWCNYLIHLLSSSGVGSMQNIRTEKAESEFREYFKGLDLSENTSFPPISEISYNSILSVEELGQVIEEYQPDLIVYAPYRFNTKEAEQVNKLSCRKKVPTIYFNNFDLAFQLGPLVLPGVSACYECFRTRMSGASAEDFQTKEQQSEAFLALNIPYGIDALALEVVKQLSGIMAPTTIGNIVIFDTWSGLQEIHPVLKMPRCKVCGLHAKAPRTQLWEN